MVCGVESKRKERKGETGGKKRPPRPPHHVLSSSPCRPPDASQGERTTTSRSERRAKRNKEVGHRRPSICKTTEYRILERRLNTEPSSDENRGGRGGRTKTAGKRSKFSKYFSSSYCPSWYKQCDVLQLRESFTKLIFLLLQSKNILPPHETFVGKQRKVQTFFVERGKLPK